MEKIALQTFEDIVDEVILERGLNYARSGSIINIKKLRNTISADCEGTQLYQVMIKLIDDFIVDYECNCPFEYGPVCKHIAALFYITRDSLDLTLDQGWQHDIVDKKNQREIIIDKILKDTEPEELKSMIREWVLSYRILSEDLIKRYKKRLRGSN